MGKQPRSEKEVRKKLNRWFRNNGNALAKTGEHCSRHAARALMAAYEVPSLPSTDQTTTKTEVDLREDGVAFVTCEGTGVRTLDDLYRLANLEPDEWTPVVVKPNAWTSWMKGDDGPIELQHVQIKATLEQKLLPPASVTVEAVPSPLSCPPERDGLEVALVIPDQQIGFRWSRNRARLLPMHDRRALSLAAQLADHLQPDLIVNLGDLLDFAEASTKFPRPVDLRDTMQPSLCEAAAHLGEQALAAPNARRIWLEGNHELRLKKYMTEKGAVIGALRPVENEHEALSLVNLLGLEGLGFELVGPYPESFWWNGIEFIHGTKAAAGGGSTVAALLKTRHQSIVQGHVHRLEMAKKTVWGEHGPRVVTAATPGCLCSLEPGAVPGNLRRFDWQQGLLKVTYDHSTGKEWYEMIEIQDGTCFYGGMEFKGLDRGDEYAERFCIPALASS
jgi:hypothetical protein